MARKNLLRRERLVQVLLKADEDLTDMLGIAQVRRRVEDCVVVLQLQQRRELLAIEFIHAHLHVLREREVEKGLLLAGASVGTVRPQDATDLAFLSPTERLERVG